MEIDFASILILMISIAKQKRRKIYYVPGLFSAISLPLLFLTQLQLPKSFAVTNYFELMDRRESQTLRTSIPLSYQMIGENFIKQIKHKKIIQFYLDGDHELNKLKFVIIRTIASQIKLNHDTLHIVRIHFSENTSYGEFVQLLNYMVIDLHKYYRTWLNNFYIFYEDPPTPEKLELIYL